MRNNGFAALLAALILSFTTYLIPLYNLHAGWQFLGSVFSGLNDLSVLTVAWIGAALLLQGLAFLLFYWVMVRVTWKKLLVLVVASPFFFVAANLSLLYAIPLLVLVEHDASPEIGGLELVCSIEDADIAQVHSGSDLGLVRAQEARLVDTRQSTLAILKMPGCIKIGLDAPNYGSTVESAAPGGHQLHRSNDGKLQHFNLRTGYSALLSAPPNVSYWNPILSDDGLILAWLERDRSNGSAVTHRLHIRNLADNIEQAIELDLPARDQFELIGARSQAGPFTLAKFRNAILRINLQGQIIRGPISPDGVYDARWGFRWLQDGWVAWDGYRAEGRSHIVWDLPSGRGNIAIPRGRGIDSLSIAEDGSVIAASMSSNISISNARSAVVLFQTSDGAELYRQFQPRFTRTNLAFLGDQHLAVAKFENNQATVEVYQIPVTRE